MELGVFSLSLKVSNLEASKVFYENLGFEKFAGDEAQKYLIMKNGKTLIGLFQGMLEANALTFNPGWDENAQEVNPFMDVREIQKSLKETEVAIDREADATSKGPEYIILKDPDGNTIMIDQHR